MDPEGLAALEKQLEGFLGFVEESRRRIREGEGLSFWDVEREVARRAAEIEVTATTRVLEAFEPKAMKVTFEGKVYRRMPSPENGTYFSLRGKLHLKRYLYRQTGVRNGPTIVPLELRAGIARGRWTPGGYQAVGFLHQALPSREAKQAADIVGVLPYSRPTLARAGEEIGADWESIRDAAEQMLIESMEIPEAAVAISVAVDRVCLPMEVRLPPSADPDAPKIEVAYEQAYCGSLTFHDKDGDGLHSIRYGRMPREGNGPIEQALAQDVETLARRAPQLKFVGLADGAPEMQNILDRVFENVSAEAIGLDFYHLIEKLSDAVKATGRDPTNYISGWKQELKTDDDAIETIEKQILEWLDETHEDDVPDGLYNAFTYISNNKTRMRYYASLCQAHLPIGSGNVEATCKTLVSVRMKRAGSRWKNAGGQACLNLRGLAQSSRWQPAMDLLMAGFVGEVPEAHVH